jgi:hypothetical protein
MGVDVNTIGTRHGRFSFRATTLNAAFGFPPIVDDVTALRTSTMTDYIGDDVMGVAASVRVACATRATLNS